MVKWGVPRGIFRINPRNLNGELFMTYRWDDVSFQARQAFVEMLRQGKSLEGVATMLDTSEENLLRYIRHHKHAVRNIFEQATDRQNEFSRAILSEVPEASEFVIRSLQQAQVDEPNEPLLGIAPPGLLTDIDLRWDDPELDEAMWVDHLERMQADEGIINVMHLCDWHEPYANPLAKDLSYQLLEHVAPDIAVIGSDFADFALLSSHGVNPDLGDYDELDIFEKTWASHVAEVKRRSPNTLRVFIMGNHERRILKLLVEKAPAFRKRVVRDFINIIRQNEDVIFLGLRDDVRLGPLVVLHGNTTTQNPAKAMVDDVGGQVSMMAGHVHRLSHHTKQGEDFTVVGVTSGCVQTIPEHWRKDRRTRRKAHYGTAIAQVNLRGREVWIDNLKFEGTSGYLSTRYERNIWTSAQKKWTENMQS